MDDVEYYSNVPYPGGRIVDRVHVNGAEQPWPSGGIRYVMRRWLGPVHLRTQGVEFTVRYVGVHEHVKKGVYPLHTHPHSELLFTLEGNGSVKLPDINSVEECSPGHLLVLPPGNPHQSVWQLGSGSDTWRVLVVNFDIVIDMSQIPHDSGEMVDMAFTPFYEWFYIRQGVSLKVDGADLDGIKSILSDVAVTISKRKYGICADVVTGLMRAISLFSRYIRHSGLASGANVASPVISKESALLKARSLLEHGFHQDAGCIVNVAQSIGMSESHFIREFKRAYGTTPKKYSTDVIMRRAAALLRQTDITIKNATYFLGFSDPSSFSRAFTKFHGLSPREFQQSVASNQSSAT